MESTPSERSVVRKDRTGEGRKGMDSRALGLLLWWVGALVVVGLCIAEPPLFPLAAVLLVVLVGRRRQLR